MSKLLSIIQQIFLPKGNTAAEEHLWHTNRQFIFDTTITHIRPSGRYYPAFKVLSQFPVLLYIFPHTSITSQNTYAVVFTANSRGTVFPNLCQKQQCSQLHRAESHNCLYTGQF
jgi:hypothetical protein